MKKTIVFAVLLIVAFNSFSQQTQVTQPISRDEYMKKSKKQKTAGWVLLAGGTAIWITGLIILENTIVYDLGGIFNGNNQSFNSGSVVFASGLIIAAGSIPFFIISAHNKHKAMRATAFLRIENVPVIQHASFISHSYPAVSVKINLK
jgi:hypothetical protein